MSWKIAGEYIAACNCHVLCPCPTGQKPSSDNGECLGGLVFHVESGECDGVDLSGLDIALFNHFPGALPEGNWTVGVAVSEDASDEQLDAVDRIFRGQEGGPFGDLSALYGEYRGTERASISYSGGDRPSASIDDSTELGFEPLLGPDGSPTTVKNAAFGFAPEFKVGTGSGRSNRFGMSFDQAHYAETARFEFASEMQEGAAVGRA